uniref:Retinal outer segment membrane protein 1 n=1 Tax=Myotis myotis TaxID=51298 RepID=A0A7J7RHM4_MYOMY|nr:retinal outer segment membrane protein 1 [Myotis myotis]
MGAGGLRPEGRRRRGGPRASSWRAGEEAGRAPFLPPSRPPPGRPDRERGGSAESCPRAWEPPREPQDGRIQSNVEGLYLTDGVPFSCCNPHSPRPCLQDRLSDPHAHPLFDPRQPNLNLWAQGCHGVLLGHLQGLASTLGSLLAVTFLLQTPVLLGLRYLQTALEGLGGVIDGAGETQGYLLPGGLRHRLRTAWLQGGAAHRPAPGEAPAEEAPPGGDPPEA